MSHEIYYTGSVVSGVILTFKQYYSFSLADTTCRILSLELALIDAKLGKWGRGGVSAVHKAKQAWTKPAFFFFFSQKCWFKAQ